MPCKHAVEGLSKSAALEAAAFGVRVNVVLPGPVQTPMLDRFIGTSERKFALLDTVALRRAGTPDEIANAIVYLAFGRLHDGRSAACERRPHGFLRYAFAACRKACKVFFRSRRGACIA